MTKKTTIVREHPRHVPVSRKNPKGITIVDRHPRQIQGTSIDRGTLNSIAKNYPMDGIARPTPGRLKEFKKADAYDELIAIWTDYFNKTLHVDPALEPDMIKALIASESGFRKDPPYNRVAIGIMQITKETLSVLLDTSGEAKDLTFKKIRQKDLKEPSIAIPLAIRWLARKQKTAATKLGRNPTHEEIILEYKGLLKSSTKYKEMALANYRKHYAKLATK